MYACDGVCVCARVRASCVCVCVCVCLCLVCVQEIGDVFRPTYAIKDPQEKAKALHAIVTGPLHQRFTKLTSMLVRTRRHNHVRLSMSDFHIRLA